MELPLTRRQMLGRLAGGFGSVALAGLLSDSALAARLPHFKPRARRIIFLFMSGGPSQLDTFDPKPELVKWEGKRLPVLPENTNKLLGKPRPLGNAFPSPWRFAKYGQSGLDVSELFPNVARRADDLCVLRSMTCDSFFHAQGTLEMMTGSGLFLRPSIGSWLLYGLGTENANLPGFVVLGAASSLADPTKCYGSAFLPAAYQGTRVGDVKAPIPNLRPQKPPAEQRPQLALRRQLTELHRARRAEASRLAARIKTFELAFRMQTEAALAFDVSKEPSKTAALYGVDNPATADYGQKCLLARRLVERGV